MGTNNLWLGEKSKLGETMNIGDLVRIKVASDENRVGKLAIILNHTAYSEQTYHILILDDATKDRFHYSRLEKL